MMLSVVASPAITGRTPVLLFSGKKLAVARK
jgi:hypothetical protein